MRIELGLIVVLALSGCQSAPPVAVSPARPPLAPSLDWQERTLRQGQHIRALIDQNDALHARVRELEVPPAPLPVVQAPVAEATTPTPTPTVPEEILGALAPNAEGVIDLVAILTKAETGAEVNPFAVRSLPAEAVREVALHVSGLIQGDAPCAIINGRTVEPGGAVETFTLLRIEPAAVVFRQGQHLLRLPVSETPVKVRLPL
jgi:hypothetical protein